MINVNFQPNLSFQRTAKSFAFDVRCIQTLGLSFLIPWPSGFDNSMENNYMKTFVAAIAVVLVGSAPVSSALAGPATDALSACLADNTTGKDRKDMARWIFVGMASHPEIESLSNVTQANRDELDRIIATMVTRLMTESCLAQARSATEKDGSEAFQAAFGIVGKLAMQELMSNPKVNASFSEFTKYIDQKKLNSAFLNK